MKDLYDKNDIKLMQQAEDSLDPKVDRVDEILLFIQHAGIEKVGIANCISFENEAKNLKQILEKEGVEVERVNCKLGKMPFSELVPGYRGVACNPVGQAQVLNDSNTQLNIMMGLCLGHDMLFNAKSNAPVTPLVVKDRKLNHNTIQKLKGTQL